MPVAIVLRTTKSRSLYRDAIIGTINSGAGNYALMCSGFFQENFKGSPYQASQEPGLAAALIGNAVQLDTVGIHNSTWNPSYINFCQSLIGAGVNLVPYLMSGFQWHAKIFLLKNLNSHVFGIIGSSNITANAFGTENTPPLATDSPSPPAKFNFECDAYLWDSANMQISAAMTALLAQDEIQQQAIITQYMEQDNLGRSIETRLAEIEHQIWESGEFRTLL
jgi:hypothetical protein